MDIYFRSFETDLAVTGDGRTISGMLAPYNEIAQVDDGFGPYLEVFERGCFAKCLKPRANYLRVQLEHNGHWVGRGALWRDQPAGLCADLRLDDTEAGREAAFKIRDGQTPGMSLAFQPAAMNPIIKHRDGREVLHRRHVKALHHVALCQMPVYPSAQVTAVRSAPQGPPERLAYWQEWTQRIRRD